MGGGYRVNNLLYQHKMPLFVSVGDGAGAGAGAGSQTGGSVGSGSVGGGGASEPHFIPEKFSDLFRDLAVPAGLFMMPPMFRPRNYAFEAKPEDNETQSHDSDDNNSSDSDVDDRDVERKDYKATKHAPNDIFDTLLSLVEAKERIQYDVKTRRHRMSAMASEKKIKNNKKSTKRRRMNE